MSELTTLARPYAEAVFKLAVEKGTLQKWSTMLEFLAVAMSDRELSWMAQNPNVPKEEFIRVLLDVGKGYIDREGENFIRLLVHNGRINLVPQIKDLFESYRAEKEGYVDVEVTTAYPLSEQDREKLISSLEASLGKKIRLQEELDRGLIGGVIIRAGDKVIDGSLQGRLERMAKRLYS